jgi:hypothetical protein
MAANGSNTQRACVLRGRQTLLKRWANPATSPARLNRAYNPIDAKYDRNFLRNRQVPHIQKIRNSSVPRALHGINRARNDLEFTLHLRDQTDQPRAHQDPIRQRIFRPIRRPDQPFVRAWVPSRHDTMNPTSTRLRCPRHCQSRRATPTSPLRRLRRSRIKLRRRRQKAWQRT